MEKHRSNAICLRATPGWTPWDSGWKITMASANGAPWTENSRSTRAAFYPAESHSTGRQSCARSAPGPAGVRALPDRRECSHTRSAGASSATIIGQSTKSPKAAAPIIDSSHWYYEIVHSLPFQSRRGEMSSRKQVSRRRSRYNDYAQGVTEADVSAGDGNGDRASVPRCDGPAFAASKIPGKRPCVWHSSMSRTASTCATGILTTKASSANCRAS